MDDYSVWTAGGTLLLFAPAVPPLQRQAVLDSLLYSQLRANKVVGSRFLLYPSWYGQYRKELSACGWLITQFFHDAESASARSVLAPSQPLRLWLDSQYAGADSIIERGLATLQGVPSSLDAFRRFTFQGHACGTRVALEIGLVQPGPQVHLCSIALQTSAALEQVGIERPLLAGALQGEILVKGLSAQLDEQQFEPRRAQLRVLIERKQQEQLYLSNPGDVQGGDHE
ncbi:hypothetical protein EXN22_04420 [Pseudomonas tructae]|uniref:Uncharacterized protein n=1 Tax=Pseudomonas tructae TaxID=2518644 RepID=A0A411MDQ6_9PSED|nr:hypothetical protein [Pseudomonas tructae]QBF24973.1 hypothetical protein EXN22_04420 [Pseudomonas tructae]